MITITRQQARSIVEASIEELSKVEDDHPRIADSIRIVKEMLEHSIRLDGSIYDESRAVRYLGDILHNAAQILRAPVLTRMEGEHEEVIIATRRDLDQFSCQILGVPFTGQPTRVLKRSDYTEEELARP
jgi:hypothetical protein